MISGFSYVHNALSVGIPIKESIAAVRPYVDEMVIVDASSTDGTREWLAQSSQVDRVISADWGTDAGETLKRLHAMHTECEGDVIIHFEADEVFTPVLLYAIEFVHLRPLINNSLHVYRIQVEQNFQRIRWYPELVHRVFPKGSVIKTGHTTDAEIKTIENIGLLWDVTNCFRDNWLARVEQQAKLWGGWGGQPNYCMVPLHANHPFKITREQAIEKLKEPHWEFKTTPLNIPEILKPLVGRTKY